MDFRFGDGDVDEEGDGEHADWYKHKRQVVAEASKAARQRRKEKLMQLREENRELKRERAAFLERIEALEAKVQELRERDNVEVHLENELLKSQLEDYENFVQGLERLAQGIPTDERSKLQIYRKGVKFTTASFLSMLSKSVKDCWKPVKIPEACLKENWAMNLLQMVYKIVDDTGGTKRLQFRMDQVFEDVRPEDCSGLTWKLWHKTNSLTDFFQKSELHYGSGDLILNELLHERVRDDNLLNPPSVSSSSSSSSSGSVSSEKSEAVDMGIAFLRETHRMQNHVTDWVYVTSRTRQELSKAVIVLPGSQSKLGHVQRAWRKMQEKLCEEPVNCVIMTRSTTTRDEIDIQDTTEKHVRIKQQYLEGYIAYSLPEMKPGKKLSVYVSTMSVPEEFSQKWLSGMEDIVDKDGYLAEKFINFARGFKVMLAETLASRQGQQDDSNGEGEEGSEMGTDDNKGKKRRRT